MALCNCSIAPPRSPAPVLVPSYQCQVQVPNVLPMPPAPKLEPLAPGKPTAGDLYRLTIDLYAYAGQCVRRIDALTRPAIP